MRNTLNRLVSYLLAPPFCGHCHTYLKKRKSLCSCCLSQVDSVFLAKVGPLKVHALSAHEYPLSSLINKSYEASVQLGTLLWECSALSSLEVDCLIPVPRYTESKKGYSASVVIAQQISTLSGIPVVVCMKRVKSPLKKRLYTKVEQYRYNQDAFRVTPDISEIEGKRVVLIDELCLSGSTLVEVARQVELGRPREMQAVVVCRAHC